MEITLPLEKLFLFLFGTRILWFRMNELIEELKDLGADLGGITVISEDQILASAGSRLSSSGSSSSLPEIGGALCIFIEVAVKSDSLCSFWGE